jgi:hypothetical protein
MDVTDLDTMLSQEGGTAGLKQIEGVKKEIILALARFVMTNNDLYLGGSY